MDYPHAGAETAQELPIRSGSPAASALIWDWQTTQTSSSATWRNRRLKGALQGLVGLVLGTFFYLVVSEHMGTLAWGVSSVILISALLSPEGAYAAIERLIDRLVEAVGKGVTLLVMVPVFYAIFLPFGIVFRRGKKDTMKRYYEDSVDSYWLTRSEPPTAADRERLF
jgi:hypothetical protein